MLDLAIDLGQRFFAAHGQHGMAEGHDDAEQAQHRRQLGVAQKAQSIVAEVQGRGRGPRRQVGAHVEGRIDSPGQQDHHHDGGDLHHFQGLVARLFDAFQVLPPVVHGDDGGKGGRGEVHRQLRRRMMPAQHGSRQPAMRGGYRHQLVQQAGNVLPGGNARDGPGQDVVEHQRGNAQLGEGAAQSLFHHAIHAAAGEHRAALHIHGAHRKGEEHDAQDEPRSRLAYRFFRNAAGIEGGRAQIVQHHRCGAPERDKGEHHRRGDDQFYPVGGNGWCIGCSLGSHSI